MRFNRSLSLCAALFAVTLSAPTAAVESNYRLVEVQGTVQIKREGRSSFLPAHRDMPLYLGDLLRADIAARARILCADLRTIWILRSNEERGVAAGCPPDPRIALRIGKQSDNTPGGSDPTIPYIISPRRGRVLEAQPILRWNPVPGAARYTVQLVGGGLNWETEVSSPEVRYSGLASLRAGVAYRVIVETDTSRSSQEDGVEAPLTFRLLYKEDIESVQADIAELVEKGLPEDTQALTIATIYSREDLFTAAIDTLEDRVASGTNSLEVYQDLGDLYRYVGLNLLAEERYEKAIEIASSNNYIEELANAQAYLAEVKVMLNQPEAAVELFTQAIAGNRILEDEERLEELQERLEEVQEQLEES